MGALGCAVSCSGYGANSKGAWGGWTLLFGDTVGVSAVVEHGAGLLGCCAVDLFVNSIWQAVCMEFSGHAA